MTSATTSVSKCAASAIKASEWRRKPPTASSPSSAPLATSAMVRARRCAARLTWGWLCPSVPTSLPELQTLDDRHVGLTAAFAHRLQAIAAAGALELVQQRRHQAGAGGSERMAEGDGATV